MVNVCKSSLKMNHREDWAMILIYFVDT
jgi:hypothetical protein